MLSRKASSECCCGPYPKPTEVVRYSIPRRSSELWLRNSAKYLRNFGRRRTVWFEAPVRARAGRSQRPGPSDCLLKTQVRAKSQDDVYGLTPARCWNVTGRGQLLRERSSEPKRQ